MVTPPGVSQASVIFLFETGTGDDVVEVKFDSSASLFDIAMSFTRLTATVETAKIEFEQQVPGVGRCSDELVGYEAFVLGSFSLIAKGSGVFILNGEVKSQETTVAIDGDAAGNIWLTGEVFPSNIEYLVKGFAERFSQRQCQQ